MRIILTNHARLRAMQRKIGFEEIVDAIMTPDHQTMQGSGLVCYKKLGSTYVLLVYTKQADGDLLVITVLKTSQIKKYFP